MSSFEIANGHKIDHHALQPELPNLWTRENREAFRQAQDNSGVHNLLNLNDLIACTDCNKKAQKQEDDSQVEPQQKLEVPANIEYNKHYGDTRPPKTVWLFVDSSGSMNDHIGDLGSQSKIDAITNSFEQFGPQIAPDVQTGLATLGTDDQGHPQFKVLVEPGLNNHDTIVRAMRNIVPTGGTPIAYGFDQMIKHCYPNGQAVYAEPIDIIYGGDGGETFVKKGDGQKDACDEVHECLADHPQGIAFKAIGIAIDKNPPEQVEEARILFDCINGTKAVNAHTVHDIVKELMATPGTLPVSNPDVDTKVHAKLLEKTNGKAKELNTDSDVHGDLKPNNDNVRQEVFGEIRKKDASAPTSDTKLEAPKDTQP